MKYEETGQTAEFQSFRMCTFKVRGHCPCHRKVNSFRVLKSLSLTVRRLRSKAFSLVCLFRFGEIPAFIPVATESLRGEKIGERPFLNFSRLLKKAHLLRFPHLSSLRRTLKYASFLRISGAWHLGIFEQPEE